MVNTEIACQHGSDQHEFISNIMLTLIKMKRSNSMNITVIFTGGTIGSSVQQDFVSTDSQMPYCLLAMYEATQKKKGAAIPNFQTEAPYTTLSEYMDGSHLNQLIACIQKILARSCADAIDGIIITHGTDTLPYTAAALGMCFAYARIPIILVSSNYILDDPRANGLTNFTAAVAYIRNYNLTERKRMTSNDIQGTSCQPVSNDIQGTSCHSVFDDIQETSCQPVFDDVQRTMHHTILNQNPDTMFPPLPTSVGIAYCNTGSTPKIYNALGIYNHYPFDDSLYERPYDAYAEAIAPVLQECSVTSHFDTTCPVCFFQSMPGMQYYLPDDTRAVLIHAYHSGTINTKNPSLLALTEQAAQKRIPVYLTGISACSTDYDSKAVYESLGIIPLPEYSPLVAYMYLWYKYSRRD